MPPDNQGQSPGMEKSILADYYVVVSAAATLRSGNGKSIGVRGRSAFGFMARALFPRRALGSRAKLRSKRWCGNGKKRRARPP